MNLALKIDIFGIGMIFYHLVFGEYPFKDKKYPYKNNLL